MPRKNRAPTRKIRERMLALQVRALMAGYHPIATVEFVNAIEQAPYSGPRRKSKLLTEWENHVSLWEARARKKQDD